MCVDLVRLHHAPGRVEVLKSGARYLTVNERPDMLERCFPTRTSSAACWPASS